MKTTELLMYATNNVRTIKFSRIDEDGVTPPYSRAFVVECIPTQYPTTIGNFDAHFANYSDAEACFKMFVESYKFGKVYISNEHLAWMTAEIDDTPTKAEEYADACMASNYGDESLMMAYNRKYEIEEDYGPSNPWDAPGMKISDFIKGVY